MIFINHISHQSVKVQRPIIYIYILILLGAVYFFFSTYDQNKRSSVAFKWVNHTHEVIGKLNLVYTSVVDFESHMRGFVITNDSVFLKTSLTSKQVLNQHIDELRKLTADNAIQKNNVVVLNQLVQQKIAFQNKILQKHQVSAQEAFHLIASLEGKKLLDAVRSHLQEMQSEERKLLSIRIAENKRLNSSKLLTNSIVTSIALVLFTIAFLQLIRENKLRRAVQASSSKNEEKYRSLVENSAVVIYAADLTGHFVYVSKKCEELVGSKPQELIGKHFTELIEPSWVEDVRKFYRNQFEKGLKETVLQFPIRTIKGEQKWVEQNVVMLFENGNPLGFQSIVKDITEKKITEDLLRKVEQKLKDEQQEFRLRLQGILDNMPMLVYLKDMEGRFLLINQQFRDVMGLSDEEVLGKTSFEIARVKDNAQRNMEIDEEVISSLKPVEIEYKKTTNEGPRSMLTVKFPLLDRNGQIFAIGGFSKDITDIVEQREKLVSARVKAEQAERLQEEFLANMSHEIRTPMNGITGMTNLLMETGLSGQQKEFVQLIKQSSDTLLVIINDVLDLSKIKAGRMLLEEVDFELAEIINQVAGPMKMRSREKGVALEATVDARVPVYLKGDSHKLIQVLNNLLSNAIKFTEKGKISLQIDWVEESDDSVQLHFIVSDSGIGISKKNLDYIFESFAQATEDTTRKFGGTGLGLSITKKLIELQGGTISVDSVVGQGTAFHFNISYTKSDKKLNESGFKKAGKTISFEGKKLLLVEDNAINQKVILHILNKAGLETDIAENGREAVDLLEEGRQYDFIIMDLQMPEMDGFQATNYIRKKLNIHTPIVAMTASALRNEKLKCFEVGMNAYITKPFVPADLFHQLHQLYKSEKINNGAEKSKNGWYDLTMIFAARKSDRVKESLLHFLKITPVFLEEIKTHTRHEEWPELSAKTKELEKMMNELQMKDMLQNTQAVKRIIDTRQDFDKIPSLIKLLQEQFGLVEPMLEAEIAALNKAVL